MLIVKYERMDFFGQLIYTEDKNNRPELQDVKKCFQFMKKNRSVTIQINNDVYYWNSISDYENEIISIRYYDDRENYTEAKKSFEKCKKEVYAAWK